jgi:hypothetical protein
VAVATLFQAMVTLVVEVPWEAVTPAGAAGGPSAAALAAGGGGDPD